MGRYDELRAAHQWNVPERYNIAAGRLRQAPARQARDGLGALRRRARARSRWGELQDLANQAAHVLARPRRERGRPRRGRAAADARDRGDLLRHLEARRDAALDVGALRRRRHPPPARRLRAEACWSPTPPTPPLRRDRSASSLILDATRPARRRADRAGRAPTRRPTTRRSSTTPRARPGWPRASSTPTATCSPTRSSSTATRSRTASASTAWASGPGRPASRRCSGPWRLGAVQCVLQREGGFDPAPAARLPLPPRGHQRLHDADGDALDDVDRATRARATRASSAASAAPASR